MDWKSPSVKRFIQKHGGVDPIQALHENVKSLLEEAHVVTPPIDPYSVAKTVGIVRIIGTTRPISGALLPTEDGFTVYLNSTYSVQKRNFVLAHEIGHTLFIDSSTNMQTGRRFDKWVGFHNINAEEEHLCDRFAAELLMPTPFFVPRLSGSTLLHEQINDLSIEFNTSITATAIRIVNTNLFPLIVILWKSYSRPGSSDKLRVIWSAKPADSRYFIPRFATPSPDSRIVQPSYLENEIKCGDEEFSLGNLKGSFYTEAIPLSHGADRVILSLVHLPT